MLMACFVLSKIVEEATGPGNAFVLVGALVTVIVNTTSLLSQPGLGCCGSSWYDNPVFFSSTPYGVRRQFATCNVALDGPCEAASGVDLYSGQEEEFSAIRNIPEVAARGRQSLTNTYTPACWYLCRLPIMLLTLHVCSSHKLFSPRLSARMCFSSFSAASHNVVCADFLLCLSGLARGQPSFTLKYSIPRFFVYVKTYGVRTSQNPAVSIMFVSFSISPRKNSYRPLPLEVKSIETAYLPGYLSAKQDPVDFILWLDSLAIKNI